MSAQTASKKSASAAASNPYRISLDIDYPEKLDKFSTLLRIFFIIPIAIILSLITGSSGGTSEVVFNNSGEIINRTRNAGGLAFGIPAAVALMIIFRQRFPRWWFDFLKELTRFQTRVGAYFMLLTDQYPSTVDEQAVHLEVDYPDVEKDLNRWLPLAKWFLAIPHYFVLIFLGLGAFFAMLYAWFVILFTGKYPKGVFDFVVGVFRWGLRVQAYVFLLITDAYPPFSLN